MKIVNLIQGTPEWHAHRAQHLNASDAPAMLGASTNHSRTDLIRELAAGVSREFSDFVQERVIDPGHEFEAQARAIAEQLVGEDLYPVTGVAGKYSASFDGLTLLEDIAWEHKRLNQTLRDAMFDGCTGTDLPLMYQIQMEHQAMVSQCERVFFMASEWRQTSGGWELVEERHCWYVPNPELRAKIVAGWAQFEADVAAYEPAAVAAPVASGRAPDQLPALRIEVTGMVTASNLAEWKEQAIAVFQGISTELVSDQDFADAETTVKWCGNIEEQLKAAKQHALSQTESIDLLFRTIDDIAAEARAKRLDLEKLVKRRKDERRTEIGNAARRAVQQHVLAINETLGEHAIPMPTTLVADIAEAMKGKRSFSSMQESVDAVAANAKIDASQYADRIRANVAILARHAEHATLFADRVQLCATKAPEDLRNLVAARIAEHQQAEQARLDAEREKIREQEQAKAQEAAAAAQAVQVQPVQVADVAPAQSGAATTASAPPPSATQRQIVRIKLGQIVDLIAPLKIDAEGLRQLGFEPVATERGSKLYDADQVDAMRAAMIRSLQRPLSSINAQAA